MPDLEVAAVGRVVAQQHQVVRPAGRLVVAYGGGDLAGDVGRAEPARVGLDVDGRGAADGERRRAAARRPPLRRG